MAASGTLAEEGDIVSLTERLRLPNYNRDDCLAAIRGQRLPHGLGHPLHRLCVIRGIRYHPGFAVELHGLLPVFTRALNARSIMSGEIPDGLESPENTPYCIWHPDTGPAHAYSELARRYPHMTYLVGRACAVAGYTELYKELAILPDVHIAEEARECKNEEIYDLIMSQPRRYDVMNDYKLSVHDEATLGPPKTAFLNGDTAVRWMLDVKQEIKKPTSDSLYWEDGEFYCDDFFSSLGFEDMKTFNITEDYNVDEYESDTKAINADSARWSLELLCSPLPLDLPTVHKDMLISMAAYNGDIDRYARLRRPEYALSAFGQLRCCIRGAYHHPMFAVWLSKQPSLNIRVRKAVNARMIMNNILSEAPYGKHDTPYLIWWPGLARESTYRSLSQIQPNMIPQIARACIFANYRDTFDRLLPQITPSPSLILEAEAQSNPHYLDALKVRMAELGIEEVDYRNAVHWEWFSSRVLGLTQNHAEKHPGISIDFEQPYDGVQCDAGLVELMACMPDAWRKELDRCGGYNYVDYDEFPPKELFVPESE